MARLYQDFIGGRTDATLLIAGTSLSSPGLATMRAVTGSDEMILVLDPDGLAGAPEVVRVTAHTAAATTATIARGAEGTTARQHEPGTDWVHGPVASDGEWRSPGAVDSTTDQAGIAAGPTDLTNMTKTFPAKAGRSYKVSINATGLSVTSSGNWQIHCLDGAAVDRGRFCVVELSGAGQREPIQGFVVVTAAADGDLTVKATATRYAGTGTLTVTAASVHAFFLVEMI